MKKLLLHEDMFFDIPNVDYKLDTELELKGPEPGEDVGVSGLLLDLIGDVAKNINDYNQLQANLENYPEVAELIKDFADDENVKLGKIQSALKTISPNAEYIMNGAVEAEQEMDPGSPIDESLNEAKRNLKPLVSVFGDDPEDFSLHVLSRDIIVDGLFNPYTWEDGVPVLKYFERDKHPKQVSDASLKKGRQFIYDRYHWKAYFPYHGGWLCVDGDDLGWDRPDDEDDLDESLKRLNEADRPDGAPINFWEPGGEDAEEYYQTNILTDMFDADPSRFEQALRDFGYDPTNYDNFDSFLRDVDKVDILNKFADLLQKNDELNSSWYDHFDFTEAPLPFDFDESLNESDGSWIQYYNSDVPVYSGDEQEAMALGRRHRISNKPLMTKDEFMNYFIDDDLAGLTPREKNDLYSLYKGAYNQKREFKDGRVFPALDEPLEEEKKRVARENEFDNGHVLYNWSDWSDEEAEEVARESSLKHPDSVYYVRRDNIMNPFSEYKWKNGKRYNRSDDVFESLDNDRWEEYYDSDLQRRFYFIDAPGGKGEITYQDNDGNGYYRCSVWLNRRTHKYRTFNVTTSLKDAKEKVEALIDKYSDSKQESFDNEYWDSSRALDLATYCWDKGYDEDKAYQVTVAQLKKEGFALPKDLHRVKTVIYDYYDEQGEGEDDFLDESYGLYEMARVKRPDPEDIKILDSGYCDTSEWKAEKQKQISKYKKQYPGVKCELVKTDTPGLRMWMTYIEEK